MQCSLYTYQAWQDVSVVLTEGSMFSPLSPLPEGYTVGRGCWKGGLLCGGSVEVEREAKQGQVDVGMVVVVSLLVIELVVGIVLV